MSYSDDFFGCSCRVSRERRRCFDAIDTFDWVTAHPHTPPDFVQARFLMPIVGSRFGCKLTRPQDIGLWMPASAGRLSTKRRYLRFLLKVSRCIGAVVFVVFGVAPTVVSWPRHSTNITCSDAFLKRSSTMKTKLKCCPVPFHFRTLQPPSLNISLAIPLCYPHSNFHLPI